MRLNLNIKINSQNHIIGLDWFTWPNGNKGVTLTETLIYIVLFGIIFLAIMQFLFTMNEGNRVATYRNEIDRSVIFLNEHLNDSFESAASIDDINSIFDSDNSKLYLYTGSGTTSINYRLENGNIILNKNAQDYLISSPRVEVTQFKLERILNADDALVGARMTLSIRSSFDEKSTKTVETSYALKQ